MCDEDCVADRRGKERWIDEVFVRGHVRYCRFMDLVPAPHCTALSGRRDQPRVREICAVDEAGREVRIGGY